VAATAIDAAGKMTIKGFMFMLPLVFIVAGIFHIPAEIQDRRKVL
jgi:hypothetical protein